MKNDVSRREVKDLVNATFGAEAQVAELAKSPCQGEGREFESRHPLVEKVQFSGPFGAAELLSGVIRFGCQAAERPRQLSQASHQDPVACDARVTEGVSRGWADVDVRDQDRPGRGDLSRGYETYLTP